ncbi:unnamed protein product [Ilex paraguariensis]|uniref:beta-ketoacyl-[acyl-carrier-protein] synthase I n=1 Tax=Ilex paraguariensis TaxID=185542 RepID=A0ABC8RPC6_9AQUA
MQSLRSPSLRASSVNPLRKQSPNITTTASTTRRVSFISASTQPITTSPPKREKDSKKRVVITGMGVVSVFGNDVDTYYDKLLSGQSGISPIDRFDASEYPTRVAGQIRGFSSDGYINGKNDRRLDCAGKLGSKWHFLLLKKQNTDEGRWTKDSLSGDLIAKDRVGGLVGTGIGGLKVYSEGRDTLKERGHRKMTPFYVPYTITNTGSALLAIDLGFMGPNYSMSTACATANKCFYAAANHIRQGEADVMIAGGTEAAILPIGLGGFVACRALSQK